ncbi:MAG: hypothetical protein GYB67_10200 [Chloroflexi bacterium]|nr:hypothetical protein [Chloroflexota bacterium]
MRWICGVGVLCGLIVGLAGAQSVDIIAIGETRTGAVTAENLAPSYFFEVAAGQVITVHLTTTETTFTPVILVAANGSNTVIETGGGLPNQQATRLVVTLPEAGQYFVQIQGIDGSTGAFTLSVLAGDVPLQPPPTATPPPTITPDAAAPAGITDTTLTVGASVAGQVSAAVPSQRYTFQAQPDAALAVGVTSSSLVGGPIVTLVDPATNTVVGSISRQMLGGSFTVPPGSLTYLIEVAFSGSTPPDEYVVTLVQTVQTGVASRFPSPESEQPTAEAATVPTSTPPPADAPESGRLDVLLRWDNTTFHVINVSEGPLNLLPLRFDGRVGSEFWAQGFPSLNLRAIEPGTCLAFRPLAYPGRPRLPVDCDDLAAWWSSDTVYFWRGASFTVSYREAGQIAVCETTRSECGLQLPESARSGG